MRREPRPARIRRRRRKRSLQAPSRFPATPSTAAITVTAVVRETRACNDSQDRSQSRRATFTTKVAWVACEGVVVVVVVVRAVRWLHVVVIPVVLRPVHHRELAQVNHLVLRSRELRRQLRDDVVLRSQLVAQVANLLLAVCEVQVQARRAHASPDDVQHVAQVVHRCLVCHCTRLHGAAAAAASRGDHAARGGRDDDSTHLQRCCRLDGLAVCSAARDGCVASCRHYGLIFVSCGCAFRPPLCV
mmetsp:Transcript_15329/g.38764  ORF Transcript_15329/g.38764 Transcript_15329/m.38764 type:complete len:245 (+) Transcript_15329:1085-1819(+)